MNALQRATPWNLTAVVTVVIAAFLAHFVATSREQQDAKNLLFATIAIFAALILLMCWMAPRHGKTPDVASGWFLGVLFGVPVLLTLGWALYSAGSSFISSGWLFVYLVGCFAAAVLLIVNSVLFWLARWMSKANVVAKNLKKLMPPDQTPFHTKALKAIGTIALEVALSWLSVLASIWKFLQFTFVTLREALSSQPERVRTLTFPLKNNPDLSPESVWAYMIGLGVTNGTAMTSGELVEALENLFDSRPSFDRARALQQLKSLHVVEPESIAAALDHFEARA